MKGPISVLVAVSAALALLAAPATSAPASVATGPPAVAASGTTSFAVIGDYGMDNSAEASVANLVATWSPSFIVATGDDYYSAAAGGLTIPESTKYDESTGAYFCAWLKDISTTGTRCPTGLAATNAFFPTPGNHDYSDAGPTNTLGDYLAYFTLPGAGFANTSRNERYYDVVQGPVHFFSINSNSSEPDGITSTSTQALWLQTQLGASTSQWNVVVDHHPPYSSDASHGSTTALQWPYAAWGADAVLSGHAHTYERVVRDGIVYFVNGLGGASRHTFSPISVTGSEYRYSANWGAQRVLATDTSLTFEFYAVGGALIDSYTLTTTPPPPPPQTPAIHVADLDASRTTTGKAWNATITITVRDAAGAAVSGVTVAGAWSTGGSSTCTTTPAGTCSVSKKNLKPTLGSIAFKVTALTKTGNVYDASANTDPDLGDSDGTTITVTRASS